MTNLNFIPTNRQGKPHVIDTTCAIFIATELDSRVSKDDPILEARIADEFFEKGTCKLNQEEIIYLQNIVQNLDIDNLLKGQILREIK